MFSVHCYLYYVEKFSRSIVNSVFSSRGTTENGILSKNTLQGIFMQFESLNDILINILYI